MPPRSGRTLDAAGRLVRVHVVERFPGQRVHQQTGPLRRIRSGLALLVLAVVVGMVFAALLSAVIYGLTVAVHHASTN